MTKKQEEIANRVINFLKTRGNVSRGDIATCIGCAPHNSDFSTTLETLKEDGYISEPQHYIYKITTNGMKFESYEKVRQEKAKNEEREEKIKELTFENLNLQNKQLRRKVVYSIIAFISGAVITNLKEIHSLLILLFK